MKTSLFAAVRGVLMGVSCLAGLASAVAQTSDTPYYFTTLAGTPGKSGSGGSRDGTGADARFGGGGGFGGMLGLAVSGAGDIYVADLGNNTIRKITPAGVVTTFAGTAGMYMTGSRDDFGEEARFYYPRGVAVDSAGNVYVADTYNSVIRKITPDGAVTTLAGTAGVVGSADGTGTAAQFSGPDGVAADSSGNVYVADTWNQMIRKITPTGVVTTLAGSFSCGSADGTGTAAQFYYPAGLAVDSANNVYVADTGNNMIRKITPDGVVVTLAGAPGPFGSGSADGVGTAARFRYPNGVAVDGAGNVYVADSGNGTIRKITPNCVVTTFAGVAGQFTITDGIGTAVRFSWPMSVAVDSTDGIYVMDIDLYNACVLRKGVPAIPTAPAISTQPADQTVTTGDAASFSVAASGIPPSFTYQWQFSPSGSSTWVNLAEGSPYSETITGTLTVQAAITMDGDRFRCLVSNGIGGGVASNAATLRVNPVPVSFTFSSLNTRSNGRGHADGTPGVARFNAPGGVAADASGNTYVADTGNHAIRKITPDGVVTTLAGTATVSGVADGTGSAAQFSSPSGVAVDSAGNVYVADKTSIRLTGIRKITPAGVVTTLTDGLGSLALFNSPSGVAVDVSGNVYVADTKDHMICKITKAGVVTTLAGRKYAPGSVDGTGGEARFNEPCGVAVDVSGNVYVADTGNCTVRKITPAGVVTTLAGTAGVTGFVDGTGTAAKFGYGYDSDDRVDHGPSGLAVDDGGNVYVADTYNHAIRKITPAGVVTTRGGMSGEEGRIDGTPSAVRFHSPQGVAVDNAGIVYVANTGNNTIRKLAADHKWTTLAGNPGGSYSGISGPWGLAVDNNGRILVTSGSNLYAPIGADTGAVARIARDGMLTILADGYYSEAINGEGFFGVTVDRNGTVYVAVAEGDGGTISPSGMMTAYAGSGGVAIAVDDRFELFTLSVYHPEVYSTTVGPDGGVLAGSVNPGSADGTGADARFNWPKGLTVDRNGNVYVADTGNHTIRKITGDGVVTTLAGSAGSPGSADGTGSAARFNSPYGVAVDHGGNVYVADTGNHTIRKITPDGMVSTCAGSAGVAGFVEGTGSIARFNSPHGVAVDNLGAIYVADTGNNAIRFGAPVFPDAPLITTQPANQVVTAGGATSFTVAASDSPTLTYRWQRLPSGSATWSDLTNTGSYSGVTTTTLTISGTTTAMNGDQFRCVVTIGAGAAASYAAAMTVYSADQVFLQRLFLNVLGREIDPGALGSFGAALTGGRPRAAVLGDLLGSTEYGSRQIEPAIRLYYAALARCPDYTGLQNWSNALHGGTLTLTGAANQFASSTEFLLRYGTLDNTGYVQQLYRNVLGREADDAGLADWVGQLDTGASRGAILVGFSESDEFKRNMADRVEIIRLFYLLLQRMPTTAELQDRIGFLKGYDQTDTIYLQGYPSGMSNASYVILVFQGFLRRVADAGALSTYVDALAAGTVTHGSMVETVMNSDEFNLFVAPVSRLYLAALRRVPDAPGLNNWVNFVRAGTSLQVMADAFASSQEFINRYGAMSNGDYVAQLYRDVLGREADAAGLADWTGRLDAGTATRGGILIGFSESQEAIHLFAPTLRTFLHYFTFLSAAPTQQDLDFWKNNLATLDDQMREDLLANPAFTSGG